MIFCYNIIVEPLTVKLLRTIVYTKTVIGPQFLLCFKINSNPPMQGYFTKISSYANCFSPCLFPRKTIFIEEALHRLVEVNYKLGLIDESRQAAAILGYNYQSSKWYERSYKVFNKKYKTKKVKKKKEMGLIRRKIKGLFE